ncbi:CWF19-like protein 1 [Saccoglossus kowalevskii]|uniref:CWF19-like protein 1-like n=1 Tax=Saccoglossus kowalevskii TaxID=10224 RepID=A0ABM0GLY5_SACKO|nr:PREDICTED: CWF19-like protein 1-like [Saccoglossus kowalevskii]
MAQKSLKILVSGDAEGKLDQLYKRVRNVQNKAGPFEMLLCVGNFFGHGLKAEDEWKKYKDGLAAAPISTYVLGANLPEHMEYFKEIDGCDLADNITYLGKRGVFNSMSGLQVAYISGIEQPSGSSDAKAHHFTDIDVTALIESLTADTNFKGVDVLLTSQWPKGVSQNASQPDGITDKTSGSSLIAKLAMCLRPRYHFSGIYQTHYERQPYRNHRVLAEAAKHVTRFIALANVGNSDKKKYLYAFNIVPMCKIENEELIKQPQDVTECPFKIQDVNTETAQADMSNQYFYDSKSYNKPQKRQQRQDGGQHKKPRPPPKPTGPCWFCLGSPEVEKHLVVSVGTHTYVALAKGGLVPDHVLILPIGHYQSSVDLPQEALDEVEKYKSCLQQMFRKDDESCVIFERNYRSQHLQLQVIPYDAEKSETISAVFQEYSEAQKLELNEIPKNSDLKQIISTGTPFFFVELESGEKFLHRIKKGFPLQFGREVLASPEILDMPERADWKACSVSKEAEASMAADFRDKFKAFDFNLM